ncbi:DUF1003 domain-containing protein [Amnibacterium flavum]|uniref:DUF1003 domain-containing protein n=1 Tax=Amnibacterium flavum TaxID=2173173 RepID=A0A2V1HRP4_9MICO|nr:DUF1003 domain-containing protein [Amnibacterium flavum]PVZ93779.1 DUF1003 domain-containing protein [Amnibacterium flavum]
MARLDSSARSSRGDRLDAPKGLRTSVLRSNRPSRDRFGRFTEFIARAMGTPWFLFALSVFVIAWMIYNVTAPTPLRFDDAAIGFTALTLILSLQASYAAPLILLAQNRQDDRDRVQIEQDRQRAERNLADTEYLAREVVALRLLVKDMASKDFIRAELRSLLEELDKRDAAQLGLADDPADAESGAPLAERASRRD